MFCGRALLLVGEDWGPAACREEPVFRKEEPGAALDELPGYGLASTVWPEAFGKITAIVRIETMNAPALGLKHKRKADAGLVFIE